MSELDQMNFEEYKVGVKELEKSGISEAYEYVLRKLCSEGLPTNNYFDLCAFYLLEFEQIMKEKDIKNKSLKRLIEESQTQEKEKEKKKKIDKTKPEFIEKENKKGYKKLNNNFIENTVEKNLKQIDAAVIIPKNKIKLKSKEFAVTNFNIELDNCKLTKNKTELIPEKIELKSKQFENEKMTTTALEVPISKIEEKPMTLDKLIEEKDEELRNMKSTTPQNVSYVSVALESFELEVDLVNHLSSSGNFNKFHYEIKDKPVLGENKIHNLTVDNNKYNMNTDMNKNREASANLLNQVNTSQMN